LNPSRPFESVVAFVARRRARWERLAHLASRIDRGRLSLAEVEELDSLGRRAAADLAKARASYPGSDAEGYLSELAARVQAGLHVRGARPGALRALFVQEIPATFRRRADLFLLAVGLVAAGLAAGALAVWAEPGAALDLVPAPVREAVAQGKMWTASLTSIAPGLSGSLIARNNWAVVMLAFALGVTGGIGTGAVLFGNGLLLGAVAVHCGRHGMLKPLLGFVAAHGPPEMLALLVSGQAGFTLASALLFPGELPRGFALRIRSREAGQLLVLAVPLLAVAALVESFLSPSLESSTWKALFGLATAGALVVYLLWPGRGAREARVAVAGTGS
jgi:uncharacterized membrane protein SpoIIM required for sporulation